MATTIQAGDEYRNKESVPGHGPGTKIIRVDSVNSNIATVTTIESNRLRYGPFVGGVENITVSEIESNWEKM